MTSIAEKAVAMRRERRRRSTGYMRARKAASIEVPFVWPDFRSGQPQWHVIDFAAFVEEGWSRSTLVYSAIMYKVRALWQVPLRAYQGDPDHPEPLPEDNPLAQLLARPNEHQSFPELQGQNIVYLNLDGNAYILMIRPRDGGIPTAMYSLRPDRVFIVPGKGKDGRSGIMGYLYVPEGKSAWLKMSKIERTHALEEGHVLAILPEDMMHVKMPNPADPLEGMGYGMSPTLPPGHNIDIDNKVTAFLKLFFDKGAMFQGLLSFDVPLTPETVGEVRRRWKDRYGGYENWAEPGILDQGGKYQRIAPTFEEMGFEAIDERNESRILGPYGVAPILIGSRIGLKHATYSNAEQARKLTWEDTLVPETIYFEVDYQHALNQDAWFVAFDFSKVPALREDLGPLVEAWVKLVTNGVPKDIATQVVGLQMAPLADGNVIYMPLNLVPVGSGLARPALPAGEDVGDEVEEALQEQEQRSYRKWLRRNQDEYQALQEQMGRRASKKVRGR